MHKRKTLKTWIMVCMMLIVILQVGMIAGCVLLGGTSDRLDQSTKQILSNVVLTRADRLQKTIAEWLDLSVYENNINQIVQRQAEEEGVSVSAYVASEENRRKVLDESLGVVLSALRMSETSSCFLILDSPEERKDAIFISDSNPGDTPENNTDILVDAGPADLVFSQDLTLNSYWSAKMTIDSSCQYYNNPMEAGNRYQDVTASNLGYFSTVFRLKKNDTERIAYSIPLLDEQHHSYGVIGISVTLDYLNKLLPGSEIGVDEEGFYCLGMMADDKNVKLITSDNVAYQAFLKAGSIISIHKKENKYQLYEFTSDQSAEPFSASIQPIQIYNSNTPFENQRLVLAGVVHESQLYSSSIQLKTTISIAIIISLIISILGALLITWIFMRPINTLVQGVKTLSPVDKELPRTGVTEIDGLASAIEKQNIQMYRYGSKVADIIDIAGVELGVIEYQKDSDSVYCTKKIFEIFDIEEKYWKDNYIGKKQIRELFEPVRPFLEVEEDEYGAENYRYDRGQPKWLSIRKIGTDETGICVIMDVTESMMEKERIKHDRDYDVLTNLYNRRAFAREMTRLIDENGCKCGVLSIWDLDNLKYTNDTYGHDMGDKYICMLGNVMKRNQYGNCVPARLSGDEFVLFMYDAPVEELEERICQIHSSLMHEKLKLPDGNVLNVSASAGMARFSQDGSTYADLIKCADFAMYQIKKSSKGSVKKFEKESYIKDYILVQGVGELGRIIAEESIQYAFQPIVQLLDKKIIAYEALIRPKSELLGRPDIFLRVAQNQRQMGQIERITWLHAIETFYQMTGGITSAKLFINSIPDQILQEEEFEELEQKYGSFLQHLVMEITETSQIDMEIERRKKKWCNRWKVATALDDYGSGYSNSETLVTKRFDYVKLDMSLIRNIHQSPSTQTLVAGMIAYCHDNGIRVIAEGIENEKEWEVLLKLGADYGQGFFFARPSLQLIHNI